MTPRGRDGVASGPGSLLAPGAGPSVWRALHPWIRPHRGTFVAAVLLGAAASAVEVASLALVGVLLQVTSEGVLGPLGPYELLGPSLRSLAPEGARLALALLVLLGIALRGLAWWGSAVLRERVGTRIRRTARARLIRRFAAAPLAFVEGRAPGAHEAILVHETERLGAASTDAVEGCVLLAMAACYVALLVLLAPALTAVAFLLLGVAVLALRLLRRPVEREAFALREAETARSTALFEALSALPLLRRLGRSDRATARFEVADAELLRARTRQRRWLDAIPPASEWIGAVVVLAILLLGLTVLPIREDAAPVHLFPYVLTFYRLLPRFLRLPAVRAALAADVGAADVIARELSDPASAAEPEGTGPPPTGPCRVVLDGVGYRHAPGAAPTLDGVRLTLEPGRVTALVGPSGAGKSTVVDLVLGVRRPTEGRVTVDGVDLATLSGDAWRRRVGVVVQEPRLFLGTVRENLSLMAPDADDDRLRAALRAAAAGFVDRLPKGLDTPVLDRGASLSGGERQRLCVARALAQDPVLLLLDEPTSQLDLESERDLTAALATAARGRTTLLVAHRLFTVRAADTVAVLVGGRIVECGPPAELVAKGGVYARWVRLGLDDLGASAATVTP